MEREFTPRKRHDGMNRSTERRHARMRRVYIADMQFNTVPAIRELGHYEPARKLYSRLRIYQGERAELTKRLLFLVCMSPSRS